MANNVVVQVLGGQKQVLDNVQTIGDVKRITNTSAYAAQVNGDPVTDQTVIQDGDFVTLSQAVKGG